MSRHPWTFVRRAGLTVVVVAVIVLAGCRSADADLAALAEQPPLPYSVLVTGGAFLAASEAAPEDVLGRTFDPAEIGGEPLPLQSILQVLQAARVFVRSHVDDRDADQRQRLGAQVGARQDPGAGSEQQWVEVLDAARRDGHDLILVIEELQDGRVRSEGVNGRWPVTLATWLVFGLGLVIPDHTYESGATLSFSLRDVQSGEELYRRVRGSGAVDLSLVERADIWGLASSILLPPTVVWDSDEDVVASVRQVSGRRLLVGLAAELKSVSARRDIRDGRAAELEVERQGERLVLTVRSREGIDVLRLRVDGELQPVADTEPLRRRLLSSLVTRNGRLEHRVEFPRPTGASQLQIVVQTLSGRLVSTTVNL